MIDNEITEVTRRAIFDFFVANNISWSGSLDEDAFLSRIFDLTKLKSNDYRYTNAAGDIHQHRVNNYDWSDDWVFYDPRFNLLHSEDEVFLRFLCETVHPVVRRDEEAVSMIVDEYNKHISHDGYTLVQVKQISGRPVYLPQKGGQRAAVFQEPTGWQKVDRQAQEARMRLDSAQNEEQYQTVGLLCREVLITVSQEVFDPQRHPAEGGKELSSTDAKGMLQAIFAAELPGGSNTEARAHARAAMNLALALQHKRTADFRMAALCMEATFSVVNLVAIIAGRRGGIIK